MALAVPGAHLFTNEINLAISKAYRSSRPFRLSILLRAEMVLYLVFESWDGFLLWRSECHPHIRLSSDVPSFGWGGVLCPVAISVVASDYGPDS